MRFIKQCLEFSKSEQRGILFLAIIIIVLLMLQFIDINTANNKKPDQSFEMQVEAFKDSLFSHQEKENRFHGNHYSDTSNNKNRQVYYQPFNRYKPDSQFINYCYENKLSKEQINILLDFFDQKKFHACQNLSDLSAHDTNQTRNIPRVDYHEKKTDKHVFHHDKPRLIEINSASKDELMTVYGIGPVFSTRILKYRKLLGGYSNISQLKEVYGINDSIYRRIKEHFIIDTISIKKINLNTTDFKTILKHPYIEYRDARNILTFRDFRDDSIENVNEIEKNNLMPVQRWKKIKPYLEAK